MAKSIWVKCDSCKKEFETEKDYKLSNISVNTNVDEHGMTSCPKCEWGIKVENNCWIESMKSYKHENQNA